MSIRLALLSSAAALMPFASPAPLLAQTAQLQPAKANSVPLTAQPVDPPTAVTEQPVEEIVVRAQRGPN